MKNLRKCVKLVLRKGKTLGAVSPVQNVSRNLDLFREKNFIHYAVSFIYEKNKKVGNVALGNG